MSNSVNKFWNLPTFLKISLIYLGDEILRIEGNLSIARKFKLQFGNNVGNCNCILVQVYANTVLVIGLKPECPDD